MIQALINRYKRIRTERFLHQTYQYQYAFIGMGQHSLTNLYPVIHHLGVPLKYICVTSERKARLIEQKFPDVKATTLLDEILKDEAVKGVFVSASPASHFSIASQVLKRGKSLFIEKPPCHSLEELNNLIDLQQQHSSPVVMAGLQKRYAPAVRLLKQRLGKEHLISYDLHYLTGAYPEGNVLLDLYIHSLDLVCFLFGKPETIAFRQVTKDSYILMLQHPHIVGTLELSTTYSWTASEETLKVCTKSGIYNLSQMEELTFLPPQSSVFGIPFEKICPRNMTVEYLYHCNRFAPVLPNNQIYTQGYFDEITSFVRAVEGKSKQCPDLLSLRPTYEIITSLQQNVHSFL